MYVPGLRVRNDRLSPLLMMPPKHTRTSSTNRRRSGIKILFIFDLTWYIDVKEYIILLWSRIEINYYLFYISSVPLKIIQNSIVNINILFKKKISLHSSNFQYLINLQFKMALIICTYLQKAHFSHC